MIIVGLPVAMLSPLSMNILGSRQCSDYSDSVVRITIRILSTKLM